MIEQYPDIITRQDGSTLACRFTPERRVGLKKVKDSVEVDVRYVIALPVDAPMFFIGEIITGHDKSGEIIVWEDTISSFHRGQLHSVAYV